MSRMYSSSSDSVSDIFSGMGYWSESESFENRRSSNSIRTSSESSMYFLFSSSESGIVDYTSTDSMYIESSYSENNLSSDSLSSENSLPPVENRVVKYSPTEKKVAYRNRNTGPQDDAPTLDDLYNFLLAFPYILDVANAWSILYAILLSRIILNKPVPKFCFFQLHTLVQKYLAETRQKLMEPPERYGEYPDKFLTWDAYTIITQELRFASFVQISVAFCKIEFYNEYVYCFEVFGDSVFHAEYIAVNRILMAHNLEIFEDIKAVTMFLPMSPCPRCCCYLQNLIQSSEMSRLLHLFIKVGALYRHYHKLCRTSLKKLTQCSKIHVSLLNDLDRKELQGYLYPENTRLRSLKRCSKL